MAALDFPSSPTLGQQFTSGLQTWEWDTISWNIVPTVVGGGEASIAVGPDAPVGPDDGDLWWDTDDPALQAGLVDPAALAANATFVTALLANTTFMTALRGLYSPAGIVVSTFATTAPTDWLMIIGQTITNGQTLHPDLWAVIPAGMKSGANIIMPDMRGRTIIGVGTGAGLTIRALSTLYGEENHVLTIAEMPAHNHGGATSAEPFYSATAAGGSGLQLIPPSNGVVGNAYTQSHTITSQGSGTAHNVMQPSIALNWIVRT